MVHSMRRMRCEGLRLLVNCTFRYGLQQLHGLLRDRRWHEKMIVVISRYGVARNICLRARGANRREKLAVERPEWISSVISRESKVAGNPSDSALALSTIALSPSTSRKMQSASTLSGSR